MPTIGEAAKMLGVGRVTLEKWMKRCHIEPKPHSHDRRFHIIMDEDLQRLKDELAQRPSAQQIKKPLYVALRSPSADLEHTNPSPAVIPAPRQRPPQQARFRALGEGLQLPDGMMSRTDVADRHSFPRSTLRRWCEEGRIETDSGVYGGSHGQFQAARPITLRGLAQFYALAHGRPDFQRCPDCPHDDQGEMETADGAGTS